MPRRTTTSAVAARSPALSPALHRRRSPRLQLLGEVHGQLVGMTVPIVLRDISDGGFSIVTTLAFPADAVHRFQLMLEADEGSAIVVQARVVHGRMMTGDLEVLYVTGFAFTPEQPHTSPTAIRTLVENARIASDSHPEAAARPKGAERRREPRLDVLGELHGFIETMSLPLIVRDLSLGGCSIETHKPLESGSTQFIRIDVYDSLSVTLQARVAHSSRAAAADRPTRYISGLQFLDADRNQVGELLGFMRSSLRLE